MISELLRFIQAVFKFFLIFSVLNILHHDANQQGLS